MSSSPVLSIYDPTAMPVLKTDCSDFCMGLVLKNRNPNEEKIVAFESKCLSDQQIRYCTTTKELSAILWAPPKYCHLLLGKQVTVKTDYKCLLYLLSSSNLSDQLARWYEILCDFDTKIEWISGKDNHLSDHMSRRECDGNRKKCRRNARAKILNARKHVF
jgi:hypothetical protein